MIVWTDVVSDGIARMTKGQKGHETKLVRPIDPSSFGQSSEFE